MSRNITKINKSKIYRTVSYKADGNYAMLRKVRQSQTSNHINQTTQSQNNRQYGHNTFLVAKILIVDNV